MTADERNDIEAAAETLRRGGIILYPTDTVWGLGCDARNRAAVERLFELKHRPDSKAMLLLCSGFDMVRQYVRTVTAEAEAYSRRCQRPTTIVYGDAHGISPKLIAADGSVAIRIPAFDFCRMLCDMTGGPVVSTSANMAGAANPSTFEEISPEVRAMADYVCTTGRDKAPSAPSDIIRINPDGSITPIRIASDDPKTD